jgi:hypothetical protein
MDVGGNQVRKGGGTLRELANPHEKHNNVRHL